MRSKLTRLLILVGLLAAGSLTSLAQEKQPLKKPASEEEKSRTEGTFKVLATRSAFGKVVKGAPYSATAVTESVQTLSDGNQIIRKNESRFYRDGEGRTRMEQSLETIGKWVGTGEPQQLITINDPVAGSSFSLDERTRTAYKEVTAIIAPDPGDPAENARVKKLTLEKVETMSKAAREKLEVERSAAKPIPGPWQLEKGLANDERRKNEMLGKQIIEGVEVVGTRSTLTIPAGEIGNILPIQVVDESWYSPELQLMVMTRRIDPRSGESTYRLTNLNRREPDRSLFEVPADYTVKETFIPAKKKPMKEE